MKVEAETETTFDERVLMSLVVDLDELRAYTGRIVVQVHAMAREHGISLPQR